MNKNDLTKFILEARLNTYVKATGKSKPVLTGSVQYEYHDSDYFYRDIYYIGRGLFTGIEVVSYKKEPIWSIVYCGDFANMSEQRTDSLLRRALTDLGDTTRMCTRVEQDYNGWRYACHGEGTIKKLSGTEKIYIGDKPVYVFDYRGGLVS